MQTAYVTYAAAQLRGDSPDAVLRRNSDSDARSYNEEEGKEGGEERVESEEREAETSQVNRAWLLAVSLARWRRLVVLSLPEWAVGGADPQWDTVVRALTRYDAYTLDRRVLVVSTGRVPEPGEEEGGEREEAEEKEGAEDCGELQHTSAKCPALVWVAPARLQHALAVTTVQGGPRPWTVDRVREADTVAQYAAYTLPVPSALAQGALPHEARTQVLQTLSEKACHPWVHLDGHVACAAGTVRCAATGRMVHLHEEPAVRVHVLGEGVSCALSREAAVHLGLVFLLDPLSMCDRALSMGYSELCVTVPEVQCRMGDDEAEEKALALIERTAVSRMVWNKYRAWASIAIHATEPRMRTRTRTRDNGENVRM